MDHKSKSLGYLTRRWTRGKQIAWVGLAELVVWGATYQAERRLRKTGPIRVLIDNSALAHGVTHESSWISTGTEMWGGRIPVDTGYLARLPVHGHTNQSETYREITYLIGISELARKGLIELVRSSELDAEACRHPPGLYSGYGWEDLSIFYGVTMPSLDERGYSVFEAVSDQSARLNNDAEEPFRTLLHYFPSGQSFDIWHLHTAHKHGVECFLTMDFKFHRQFQQSRKRSGFPGLQSKPWLPSELGRQIGLHPIHTFLVSHRNERFFTRHDLHMPDQRRRSRHSYRRQQP
jgi:hypothetical protein